MLQLSTIIFGIIYVLLFNIRDAICISYINVSGDINIYTIWSRYIVAPQLVNTLDSLVLKGLPAVYHAILYPLALESKLYHQIKGLIIMIHDTLISK